MKRRHFLGILTSATALAACSSNNVSLKTLREVYDARFGKASSFDPELPDTLPYASIAVTFKNWKKLLLILGKVEGDEQHWISEDRGVLVTRFGRIIKTVGLPEELLKTVFHSPDFFERTQLTTPSAESARRSIDLSPGNRYAVIVNSTLTPLGDMTAIQIGKHIRQVRCFEENGEATALSWRFTNRYWADASGFVWKSEQQTSPNTPIITIEVAKPYGN
ncbi:YjbF family lipoprotein [Propionivibrio dicarboxylicus]|uniref:Group 4 capsule polysaccharide lipoprotein gfcB, YjbF n=1 Tax=Propionivibrio dicarboxylicus TaxID=83767 RepID=A0A1G8NQE9_9RHOO|nr:YjbF family lipoprotein [Propionivibrio dicarboxylicus]SDH67588.1 Group 4 capsule polysaccharide lipoprotein gfcB, YjbF [Propionivibrio dicarboxylicus]SDI82489.1 Group 4 capsule polysaccharide lipoprotein gfcB, YjbF [Propionivibrio dicarboxylicus]